MVRYKSALVFLLLCIMVLILSPWTNAPSPVSPIVTEPKTEALAITQPAVLQEISELTVKVALEEAEFNALVDQNKAFALKHPEITVELQRVDPEQAYSVFKLASQLGESADIMLLANEWVKEFATSGYLLPADASFVGKALTEQFEALTSPLKWNGYLWGVPRSLDPFVLVWNTQLMHEWLGENANLPLTIEQWSVLASKNSELQGMPTWLTLNPNDPLMLLAWLESVTGERSDGIWTEGSKPWLGTSFEQALALLDQHRSGISWTDTAEKASQALKNGETLVAIVPYSVAASLLAEPRLETDAKLELDHHSWKLPYVWPRGSSFAISAHTEAEDAVYTWVAELTNIPVQLQNMEVLNRLPVYRSLYDSDRQLSNLLPGNAGKSFPNQASLNMEPELPERLEQLGLIWNKFAMGEIGFVDWNKEWTELITNS